MNIDLDTEFIRSMNVSIKVIKYTNLGLKNVITT